MKKALAFGFVVTIATAGAVGLKAFISTSRNLQSDLQHSIGQRAQLYLFEDFQKGLDSWEGQHSIGQTWSYDASGLVIPGEISFFKPSMQLTDYEVETWAEIVNKGFGLAYRAAGPRNYHALKFTAQGSGAAASLAVERYTVIDGTNSAKQPLRGKIPIWKDQVSRIKLVAHGDSFALYSQGQLVDHWSDSQLKSGGVGLFCDRGERARIISMQVSHQVDITGKLCAWLAWFSTESAQE